MRDIATVAIGLLLWVFVRAIFNDLQSLKGICCYTVLQSFHFHINRNQCVWDLLQKVPTNEIQWQIHKLEEKSVQCFVEHYFSMKMKMSRSCHSNKYGEKSANCIIYYSFSIVFRSNALWNRMYYWNEWKIGRKREAGHICIVYINKLRVKNMAMSWNLMWLLIRRRKFSFDIIFSRKIHVQKQ